MTDERDGWPAAQEDPILLFERWLREAEKAEPNDPNAMALATATADGRPSVRMVLLKGFGDAGFVFYSNAESRKGAELAENPHAALLFHWKSLRRQVRVEGAVSAVSEAEADAYFASRARQSQLGARASAQSRILPSRAAFLTRVAEVDAEFAGRAVPRPDYWRGWRVAPEAIEFWRDMEFRLHERVRYLRQESGWACDLLFP